MSDLSKLCAVCDTPTDSLCSGCKRARFCSPAHQKLVWVTHKHICKSPTVEFEQPPLTAKEIEFLVEKFGYSKYKVKSYEAAKNRQKSPDVKLLALYCYGLLETQKPSRDVVSHLVGTVRSSCLTWSMLDGLSQQTSFDAGPAIRPFTMVACYERDAWAETGSLSLKGAPKSTTDPFLFQLLTYCTLKDRVFRIRQTNYDSLSLADTQLAETSSDRLKKVAERDMKLPGGMEVRFLLKATESSASQMRDFGMMGKPNAGSGPRMMEMAGFPIPG